MKPPNIEVEKRHRQIPFLVLAILALGIAIAIWFFHHRSEKTVPKTHESTLAQCLNARNRARRSETLRPSGLALRTES
jgi:hypothetical protein